MSTVKESAIKVVDLPVAELHADASFNCRGEIAPIDVTDLARSMDQHGLQLPIEVQTYSPEQQRKLGKVYRIICGHRRHKAAQVLKWETIPAIIKDGLSEAEARVRNLTENLNRKDLNVLQEARALSNLKKAGLSQDDVSRELNKSRGWVQVRYMLLDLPEEIQQEAGAGLLNQEQIRDLFSLRGDLAAQAEAVRAIKEARSKGEKPIKVKKAPRSIHAKEHRSRPEIFEMIDHIGDVIGMGFYTRCLAWAAGEISDRDLFLDLKIEAEKKGKPYEVPTEALSEMSEGGYANSAW